MNDTTRTVFLSRALEPIRRWLSDDTVVEICANRPGEVWVEVAGGTRKWSAMPCRSSTAPRYAI